VTLSKFSFYTRFSKYSTRFQQFLKSVICWRQLICKHNAYTYVQSRRDHPQTHRPGGSRGKRARKFRANCCSLGGLFSLAPALYTLHLVRFSEAGWREAKVGL